MENIQNVCLVKMAHILLILKIAIIVLMGQNAQVVLIYLLKKDIGKRIQIQSICYFVKIRHKTVKEGILEINSALKEILDHCVKNVM